MRIVIEIDHDGALSVHQSTPTDVLTAADVNAGDASAAFAAEATTADSDGGPAPTDVNHSPDATDETEAQR